MLHYLTSLYPPVAQGGQLRLLTLGTLGGLGQDEKQKTWFQKKLPLLTKQEKGLAAHKASLLPLCYCVSR